MLKFPWVAFPSGSPSIPSLNGTGTDKHFLHRITESAGTQKHLRLPAAYQEMWLGDVSSPLSSAPLLAPSGR